MATKTKPSIEELRAHYAQLPAEYGFASQCKMTLVGDLNRKRVLDIGCRRGKGVVKLSSLVGQDGWAMGVDPNEGWIALANGYIEESLRKNGFSRCNMSYEVAFPEDLSAAGIGNESFDLVFTNGSVFLDYDPEQVFSEAFRVLCLGGILIYDGTLARSERNEDVVVKARRIGNSIQASPERGVFETMIGRIGFDKPAYFGESAIRADAGYDSAHTYPLVETDEDLVFVKTTAYASKSF